MDCKSTTVLIPKLNTILIIRYGYEKCSFNCVFRCLRGDWAGVDDPSVYNCSVAVAEARAAK